MKTLYGLVFFATGWGPTKGGINSFNFDFCNALGKQSDNRSAKVYCICPGTTTEQEKKEAKINNIKLIDIDEKDFKNCKFDTIISEEIALECTTIFWFGHDVITGKQANNCRDKYKANSKSVIFHHMNYSEYYFIGTPEKIGIGENKENEQREVFQNADYAIAIGPKLFTSLMDLKAQASLSAECTQIIPGLADIEPIEKEVHKKTILFTGRLEKDNDAIKQYSITINAVSDLFKNKDVKLGEIELKLIGLVVKNETELNEKIEELKRQANCRAGCIVPVKSLEYTSNREDLFKNVRNSSIVIMPSISEGFGLAGFEGIAAGVPTVISKNSGLYEFLRRENLDGYITGIEVVGGTSWENPGEQDINNAYLAFKEIIKNYEIYKNKALELRQKILNLGYTWEKTAKDTLDFLKISEIIPIAKILSDLVNTDKYGKNITTIIKIANRCVTTFAQNVKSDLKIDKDSILSLKADNFLELQNTIISMLANEKYISYFRDQSLIQYHIFNVLQNFLKEVTEELKKIESISELDELFIIDEKQFNECGIERKNEIFDNDFYFSSQLKDRILRLMEEANINALLSESDYTTLKEYHKCLIKTYNVLNFEGLSVMASAGAQYIPLNAVYASMHLKRESNEFFDINLRRALRNVDHKYDSNIELYDKYKRLIIKGDPGSGKSTYLKKQLITSCYSDKKYMCVFFKVSEFIKWISEDHHDGAIKQFSEYIYHVLSDTNEFCQKNSQKLKNIYDKLRNTGGIVYFIDGLDEVQDSDQKKKINQQIMNFVKEAESCKYIVTSRKVGLDEEFFKSMDFTIKEIAPLSKKSIEDYIHKWYNVVAKIPNETQRNCNQSANDLIASIENNYQLLSIAKNPLLLSIIVILHHHGINPPSNRAMLYQKITKTLLVTWMERRHFAIKYPFDYLNNFFSRVAFEIVTNNYSTMTIPESKLKTMYLQYLTDRNYEDDDVENFICYISDDAGILSPQGFSNNEKLYGFLMHRQIAEYYASIALENKLFRREISFSAIINESKWTEVSILMGGNMSMQSDAGQDRVNQFIKQLFKTKSKPIEDFKYNILLILKWVSNSTFINKENLDTLIKELNNIFKSSNRYRVLRFCDDVVNSLSNGQCKRQICDWLVKLLDDNELNSVRNASVVINVLLKSEEQYEDILNQITDDRIIKSLLQLIKNKDFDMLYRNNGCYQKLFIDYFIKCINKYYESSIGTQEEEIWHEYLSVFANSNSHYGVYTSEDLNNLLEKTVNGKGDKFKNPVILNEYIHMLVLYTIGFNIAKEREVATSDFKDFCENAEKWNCKPLIESAINLSEDALSIGEFYLTYVGRGVRVFHKKDENGHKLTIFSYNRETQQLEKYKIILKNDFSLDDIKNQIDDNFPLTIYQCLDRLYEIELPQEKKSELFNLAYSNGVLLTGTDWHQSLLEKIKEDNEVFYKNYDAFKIWISFDEETSNSKILKEPMKTFYKYFAHQREKITPSERKTLVCLYKKEETMRKNILFDILYDLLNYEINM